MEEAGTAIRADRGASDHSESTSVTVETRQTIIGVLAHGTAGACGVSRLGGNSALFADSRSELAKVGNRVAGIGIDAVRGLISRLIAALTYKKTEVKKVIKQKIDLWVLCFYHKT